LIGATLAYLAIVEITKRIFYMSVAKNLNPKTDKAGTNF
jgi:hypothetical protein